RAEIQAIDTHARTRYRACVHRRLQPGLQPLTSLRTRRHDHDEGETVIRKHRVEGQKEPRRAGADVSREGLHVAIPSQQLLGAARRGLCHANPATLGQANFDEELGARGRREKLLLDEGEARAGRAQREHHCQDHGLSVSDRPAHGRAQQPKDSRPMLLRSVIAAVRRLRQQLHPEERREDHGDEPGDDERETDHPENAARNIGKAVEVQAKLAASSRSIPCSIFTTIISMAMMASSTSSPSAMMSAPSETRSRFILAAYITVKTIASTSGTASATMIPLRHPSEMKLTASTMISASTKDSRNSPTDSATTFGWSAIWSSWMPIGIRALRRPIAAARLAPSSSTLPPSAMATTTPTAGLP